jgi:hypothetical protein
VEQARTATFDLNGDDGIVNRVQRASQLTWDRKKRKFIKGDGVGADNKKLIRSESGARLPASFKSGRFDEWKAKKKLSLPKVGESEGDVPRQAGYSDDRRYRHNKVVAPKPLDPKATTYEKKMYVAKKKAERTAAASSAELPPTVRGKARRGGEVGQAKSELRSVEDIRKQRKILEQVRPDVTPCWLEVNLLTSIGMISPLTSDGPRMRDRPRRPKARAKVAVEGHCNSRQNPVSCPYSIMFVDLLDASPTSCSCHLTHIAALAKL